MKKFIATTYLIIASLTIAAQDGVEQLSLNDYRQRVLDYSQELKKAQENTVGATYSRKAAAMGYLPQLDLTANAEYNILGAQHTDNKLDPLSYSVGASFVQPLYAGGAILSQHRMAKINVAISETTEQLTLEEVLYKAELIYWQAAVNKEMLANAENYYEIVKTLFDVVDKRFDEGYVSKSDLLMVNTRLKEAELQRNSAQRSYTIAFQHLNILMGSPINTVIDLSETLHNTQSMPAQQALETILQQRPEYKILEQNILKQEQLVSSIHAAYNPQISIGLKGGWGVPTTSTERIPTWNTIAFASLTFPLLDWGERTFKVRAAKAEIKKLSFDKTSLTDKINTELSSAWINLNDNLKRINIAQENLTIATQNLDLNTIRYNEGQIPILDVLSSQLSWIQASNATTQAEYSYKIAFADYKKAAGAMQSGL